MSYRKFYSEDNFWNKIKSVFKNLGERVVCQILTLYYLMKYDKVSIADKLLIIGTLGYFILPTDMVPDILPSIGYVDDISAIVGLLIKFSSHIDDNIVEQVYNSVNNYFEIDYSKVKKYVYNIKL